MSHARAGFSAELASVGEARRFVRRALVDLGADELEFEACQLVSELATNAVIHAATPFEVDLDYGRNELHIRVSDASPKGPVIKSHSDSATTGRGLRLVGTMADQWGVDIRPDGKTVWCTVRPDPPRSRLQSFGVVADDLGSSSTVPSTATRLLEGFSGASRSGRLQ